MYVHGMSTRDIRGDRSGVLSGTGVSEVRGESGDAVSVGFDFEVFRKRDDSSEELLYLGARRDVLALPPGSREERARSCDCHRLSFDGTRVLRPLLGVGNGESYANWKGFLQEMVARGPEMSRCSS